MCSTNESVIEAWRCVPVSGTLCLLFAGSGGECIRRKAVGHEQEAVPDEPPAKEAEGRSLFPTSVRTRSSGTPSASAAICARTVRAPVPMSVASTRTAKFPSGRACAVAGSGRPPQVLGAARQALDLMRLAALHRDDARATGFGFDA